MGILQPLLLWLAMWGFGSGFLSLKLQPPWMSADSSGVVFTWVVITPLIVFIV